MSENKRFVLSKKVIAKEDNQPMTLGVDDDVVDNQLKEIDNEEIDENVLPKYFVGSKLDSILPSYKERRKSVKNVNAIKIWNKKINSLLKLYDQRSDKYNFELLIGVCQIVEDNMIFKERCGEDKKRVVINILLPFFNNDLELLDKAIEFCLKDIQRSSMRKRLLKRLYLFFFTV